MIHVTGTNGKTSTARMTETLLRARGLRTGLFTSPHLSSMRERICIDGEPLSAEDFVAAYEEIAPYAAMVDGQQAVQLSFFEVLTAMAFAAFADAPVDVAVIEVGLGGTWDATNIADGAVAVVTPVALDHTAYLGDTVAAIATEKAGIIKPGAVAVLARQPRGGRRGAGAAGRRGGRAGAHRGHGLRRDRPRPGRRRAAARGVRPEGQLPRPAAAAVRRAPGAERGLRARRGGGLLRRPGRWTRNWSGRRSRR